MTFSMNSAKSFVGKNVNLHMKDDSVLVNVKVEWARGGVLCYSSQQGRWREKLHVQLRDVLWAEQVNMLLVGMEET